MFATRAWKQRAKVRAARARAVKIAAAATAAGIALIGCLSAGCTAAHGGPSAGQRSEGIPAAAEGVAAIEVHTQTAQRQVQAAIPHADATGQTYLGEAKVEHQAVLNNAAEVRQSLGSARTELTHLSEKLQEQQMACAKLQNQWYVVWGLRVEKLFWTVAVVWLIGGIASVLLGLGTPLGWLTKARTWLASLKA